MDCPNDFDQDPEFSNISCEPQEAEASTGSSEIEEEQKKAEELAERLKKSKDKIINMIAAAKAKAEAEEKIYSDTEAIVVTAEVETTTSAYSVNEPGSSGSSGGDSISRHKVTIPPTVPQDTEQALERIAHAEKADFRLRKTGLNVRSEELMVMTPLATDSEVNNAKEDSEIEEQERKNAEYHDIIQIQRQEAQRKKHAAKVRLARLNRLYERGIRKLSNPENVSDEDGDPPLPTDFRTYQKVWATEERHGTEQFKTILLGALEPHKTVVIQWDGCHKVGEGTECKFGTVAVVEFNQISPRISETYNRTHNTRGESTTSALKTSTWVCRCGERNDIRRKHECTRNNKTRIADCIRKSSVRPI